METTKSQQLKIDIMNGKYGGQQYTIARCNMLDDGTILVHKKDGKMLTISRRGKITWR